MGKLLIILILMSVGCTVTLQEDIISVDAQYKKIGIDDGITSEEALIVAQQELIDDDFVKIYDLMNPFFIRNTNGLPDRENYWFVSFKERDYSTVRYVYTVIIHKETGLIKFSDDYPIKSLWILEAALLK